MATPRTFLGGVADVLQKTVPPNVDVTHLGDLAAIGLYLDDRQISRLSYQELSAAEVSYRVRISAHPAARPARVIAA